jgi:hypothetical protein
MPFSNLRGTDKKLSKDDRRSKKEESPNRSEHFSCHSSVLSPHKAATKQNEKELRAMTDFVDTLWNKQYEKLVAFKRKNCHCRVTQRYQEDASLGKWVDASGSFIAKTHFGLIERDYWTRSGSFGTVQLIKIQHGISNMKSWSSLNKRMAIVSCQKGTKKTRLLGSGLVNSGCFIAKTNFGLIERDYWRTRSGSFGELELLIPYHGISNMKSWSSLNKRMAIVSCQKSTRKTWLLGIGLVTSGEAT